MYEDEGGEEVLDCGTRTMLKAINAPWGTKSVKYSVLWSPVAAQAIPSARVAQQQIRRGSPSKAIRSAAPDWDS